MATKIDMQYISKTKYGYTVRFFRNKKCVHHKAFSQVEHGSWHDALRAAMSHRDEVRPRLAPPALAGRVGPLKRTEKRWPVGVALRIEKKGDYALVSWASAWRQDGKQRTLQKSIHAMGHERAWQLVWEARVAAVGGEVPPPPKWEDVVEEALERLGPGWAE